MPTLRVLRPLLALLATLALAVLVVADRLRGGGVQPLGLSPRLWASVLFPVQAFSFTLAHAVRARRKPPRASANAISLAAQPRLSTLEFAELCAIMLTIGYSLITDERLDASLRPGWRLVVVVTLVLVPVMAKLITERTGS
jgi:hypothetical protein